MVLTKKIFTKKKILIIEDNRVARESIEQAFRAAGYDTLSVESGNQGLIRARREKPDIVLLDLMLPDIDGLEVLKRLSQSKKTRDIKVVVLTNLSDEGTISKIVRAGGRDYLVKSDYSLTDIVKKVSEILKK